MESPSYLYPSEGCSLGQKPEGHWPTTDNMSHHVVTWIKRCRPLPSLRVKGEATAKPYPALDSVYARCERPSLNKSGSLQQQLSATCSEVFRSLPRSFNTNTFVQVNSIGPMIVWGKVSQGFHSEPWWRKWPTLFFHTLAIDQLVSDPRDSIRGITNISF